jgi:16S rRNA (guanine966-N2)-methyltransferase
LIRITGGEFRGRKIKSPHGTESRPTLDRVREALFNILGNNLSGIRFLDLYAGIGLVGLEALSRGASEAVFVEKDERLVKLLRENVHLLGVENRAKIYQGFVSSLILRLLKKPADILFLDPPYGSNEAVLTLFKLGIAHLSRETLIVVQHHYKDKIPNTIGNLLCFRQERYGESSLSFFIKNELQ